MQKALMRIAALVAILAVICAALGVVSSVAQLSTVVDQFVPGAGRYFFLTVCGLLLVLALVPVYLYFRMPPPLVPPADDSGQAQEAFMRQLKERLSKNPALAGDPLETQEDVARAMHKLGALADALVKQHASTVFLSTAVMQNGRLDGLVVLLTQLRMVWLVSNVFFQRPSPRQLLYLYGNVGTSVILAQNIQDIEFTELAAPIVISVFPSLNGAIPGMQGVTNLVLNSLANGSANAFMTLRVGVLARMYCESLHSPEGGALRSSATRRSLELLGTITREQGTAIANGALGLVGSKLGAAFEGAKSAGGAIVKGAATAGGSIVKGAASAGGTIVKGATTAGETIVKGATTAGGTIVRGATSAGSTIVEGATSAGGAIVKGAASVGGAIAKGAKVVTGRSGNDNAREPATPGPATTGEG